MRSKRLFIMVIILLISAGENLILKAQNDEWLIYRLPSFGRIGFDKATCLAVDNQNNIWIGTTNGLFKFNGLTYESIYSELPSDNIASLLMDYSDNLWILSNHVIDNPRDPQKSGLTKFDGMNWTIHDTSNSSLPNTWLTCFTIDRNDVKYIGSNCLIKFDENIWTVYDTNNTDWPGFYINCISVDYNNIKWIGTDSGLVRFNGNSWNVLNTSNSNLPSNKINCIGIDNNNYKWIGTDNGLAVFNDSNWTIFNNSNSKLISNNIYCLLIDSSGNKWIGSQGLVKYNGYNWTIYDTLNSALPSNFVLSIVSDRNNNLLLLTDDCPFYYDPLNSCLAIFKEGGIVSSVKSEDNKVRSPDKFILSQNYPNPFNPTTKIKYAIPNVGTYNYPLVQLKIYDVLGREVTTLINEIKRPGEYEVEFNANNLPTGVYFYQLKAGEFIHTKKMILLK